MQNIIQLHKKKKTNNVHYNNNNYCPNAALLNVIAHGTERMGLRLKEGTLSEGI